jgi:hypothetical protein
VAAAFAFQPWGRERTTAYMLTSTPPATSISKLVPAWGAVAPASATVPRERAVAATSTSRNSRCASTSRRRVLDAGRARDAGRRLTGGDKKGPGLLECLTMR